MTKESKPGKNTQAAKPERKSPPQPAYVQFQGGFQSGRGGNSGGGGKRPTASGSPIRKSAPSGGGK